MRATKRPQWQMRRGWLGKNQPTKQGAAICLEAMAENIVN